MREPYDLTQVINPKPYNNYQIKLLCMKLELRKNENA